MSKPDGFTISIKAYETAKRWLRRFFAQVGHFRQDGHIVITGVYGQWSTILAQKAVSGLKISDFQTKDVINIVDGKKLGQVSDLELDLRQGRIDSIVVPTFTRFFGMFGGGTDIIIPWRNIVKIGADVVLVRLDEAKAAYKTEEEETQVRM